MFVLIFQLFMMAGTVASVLLSLAMYRHFTKGE